MNTLYLHVTREYFDAIQSGEKDEEYRLITPFWRKRLVGRDYDQVQILMGYPHKDDFTRRLEFPYRGCTQRRITHPHFGADWVDVFVIPLRDPVHPANQALIEAGML